MKEFISGRQTSFMSQGAILGTIFLPIGQTVAAAAGRDGWMVVFPALCLSFPFVYLTLYTYLKAPGKNILEQLKTLLGPWLGYPVIAIYCLNSGFFTSLMLRQGGELFARSLMIETPLWVFIVGILFLLIFTVYLGMEVFARISEIVVIPILLSLLFLIVFSAQKAELAYLKPYLYNGFQPLVKGTLAVPWGFEYLWFLWVLIPYIHKPHELIRASLRSYIIISILVTGVVIAEFCVFSPEESSRLFYGAFSLARIAEIGRIFHGLEPFFIIFWFGANAGKVSVFFFCTYQSFRVMFPIKHGLLPVSIMGTLIAVASMLPVTSVDLVDYLNISDKYIIFPISSLGICLLALIVYVKSRRKQ